MIFVLKDTMVDERRQITLRCTANRPGVNTMGMIFDDSTRILQLSVNGKEPGSTDQFNKNQKISFLTLLGVPKVGFEVKLVVKAGARLGMQLTDRSMGLPDFKNLTQYPEDVIPGTDFNCNTLMIRKHFTL